MTVHMVRIFFDLPKGNADNAVDNWVQNHNEWENDPVSHSLTEKNTEIDGSGVDYVSGDYRFIQEETVTKLLDDLGDRLSSVQGGLWYRIGYHACDHDEDQPTPCSWDETREGGTVPDAIPTIEVEN